MTWLKPREIDNEDDKRLIDSRVPDKMYLGGIYWMIKGLINHIRITKSSKIVKYKLNLTQMTHNSQIL
jgi:hypothetical protein